ncbi:MAG: hypothetical protein AAF206_27135 [Bacteroidota bacterium]
MPVLKIPRDGNGLFASNVFVRIYPYDPKKYQKGKAFDFIIEDTKEEFSAVLINEYKYTSLMTISSGMFQLATGKSDLIAVYEDIHNKMKQETIDGWWGAYIFEKR